MLLEQYCRQCGTKLIEKELEGEGVIPYCPHCGEYRFPQYNVAVSMIVIDKTSGEIILIKQYGKPDYILVAGYVNRGEALEHAVAREIMEETGMKVDRIKFNRTHFFEPSNTLMCNFTAYVANAKQLHVNREVDSYNWFKPSEARRNIKPNSLAAYFLNSFLDETK